MFITVGDAKIFATSFGSPKAPAILGVGGWVGSWEVWAEPFSLLSAHWRTLAYDHRGAGATIAPVESITFDQMVADVFTVLDAYGVERCVLAAESMGALSVLGAALKQPERITGLVIVDGMYYRKPNPEPDLFLMGLKMDYPQTIQRFVQMCAPEPTDEPIRYWGRQIVDRATQASALALYHLAGAVDLRNALPRINQPTLIIHCDGDALVPLDAARTLAKTLPHARLNIIRGASHVPTLTHPHAVAHAIVEFFKQA